MVRLCVVWVTSSDVRGYDTTQLAPRTTSNKTACETRRPGAAQRQAMPAKQERMVKISCFLGRIGSQVEIMI